MFNAIMSYIAGRVRIKVRGLNLDRLIAALLKEGFVLRNLKRPSYQVLTFEVRARSGKKAVAFLKKQGYEFETAGESGLPGRLRGLVSRAGLIIGLVLCIAAVVLYNGRVRNIRIEGIERISKAEVAALLDEMGVKTGASKKSIDNESIAVALNTRLPDAANVTVRLKGTSLIINIYETLFKEPVINPNAPRNVVSAYDAIITKVVTLNGTARVGAGDIVRKGEILIAGYNLDAAGNMSETRADGEVTGKVFFSADNVFFKEREEYIRTGGRTEKISASVFGIELGVKKAADPYPLFEKETVKQNAFKNFFIPVAIVRETYWELALQTAEYDYEQYKDGIVSEVTAAARAKVPRGANITGEKTDVRQIDKYVFTVYNIETEILVGR